MLKYFEGALVITIESAYRSTLVLLMLIANVLFCGKMWTMQNAEHDSELTHRMAAALSDQTDTPEQLLNRAAEQWIRERNHLIRIAKRCHCCQKICGTACEVFGVGLFDLGVTSFDDAKYNSDPISAGVGLALTAAGVISTTVGIVALRIPITNLEKDLKELDAQYIAGTFKILTIKPELDETQLTPQAKKLLALAHQNPFYNCDG